MWRLRRDFVLRIWETDAADVESLVLDASILGSQAASTSTAGYYVDGDGSSGSAVGQAQHLRVDHLTVLGSHYGVKQGGYFTTGEVAGDVDDTSENGESYVTIAGGDFSAVGVGTESTNAGDYVHFDHFMFTGSWQYGFKITAASGGTLFIDTPNGGTSCGNPQYLVELESAGTQVRVQDAEAESANMTWSTSHRVAVTGHR